MLHKGIEIRSAHSRISFAEILSRPVALDLDNLFKREKTLLLLIGLAYTYTNSITHALKGMVSNRFHVDWRK